MPPKIKRRPLFKATNKRTQASATKHDPVYGKPVKRRRGRSAASTPSTNDEDSNSIVRQSSSTLCSADAVSNDDVKNPPGNSLTLDMNEESVVTDKMLDDALFGSELAVVELCGQSGHQNVLTPVLESSPISPQGKCMTRKLINEADEFDEDILAGLCPEDLNFSLNISNISECAKTLTASTGNENERILKGLNKSADDITRTTEIQFIKSSELLSKKQIKTTEVNTTSDHRTFYGLPLRVKECYEEFRGIKQLYDWQHRCLSLPSVSNGGNLIYSLPTSGGKTLVAEIIILRQLLIHCKDVLLILPFVSIVQEKVRQLTLFSTTLGFAVEEYAASKGTLPPRQRRKKKVLYIATIEKGNGLVNSLIELERMSRVGLVVVDELHMLGDGSSRGATLESCLAKLQHCSPDTQLVGMSATLGNMADLATFMKAQLFSSNFRPVELVEQVKLGKCVYGISVDNSVNFDPVRDIGDHTHSQLDPDQLTALVMEVVPDSSCLIFCPTKKSCENVALLLTKTLPRTLRGICLPGKQQLLNTLSLEASGVCPTLAKTIPFGVAYHHSGLTADERRIVEDGYLDGVLCVIACTSTLAAGVNLPAKRVILRSPYIGSQLMSRSQYKQMVGRAGRSGLCNTGDSILILSPRDKDKVAALLSGPYEVCRSSLLFDDGATLLSLILNITGLLMVQCFSDLQSFFTFTLLHAQHDHAHLDKQCADAVAKLVAMSYITLEPSGDLREGRYLITPLGRAAFKGCLRVDQAHLVYREMRDSLQQLMLSTDLHLLFLATPLDLGTSIQPNWMVYFQEVTGLGEDELRTAEQLGVKPGYLAGKATGAARGSVPDEVMRLYHRFYITLILHSLLKLTTPDSIWRVADKFHCSRGFLQSIMNSTASYTSCLVHFTAELPELWSLHLLLPAITMKLTYSSHLELVPLMEVSGVKQGRARQLLSAGITTPHQLASSDPHELVECVDNLFPKHAKRLILAAKALLADQAEALMEEAEELMSLAPTDFINS